MNQTQETMSFSRLRKPLEYALVAGLLVILAGFAVWAVVRQGDILLSILITAAFLVPVGLLVAIALLRVKISSQGISLSLCGITLKKIKASDIHTITLTETSIRYGTLVALAVFSIPAEEMEADGERRLRENVILKEELKFREGRSDWGDICMGMGFYRDLFPKDESPLGRWKSGIWLEFSPEREELLRKAFPQAQYRTPKRYSAPPNRN